MNGKFLNVILFLIFFLSFGIVYSENYVLSLKKGWNLISIPLAPSNIESVKCDISSI